MLKRQEKGRDRKSLPSKRRILRRVVFWTVALLALWAFSTYGLRVTRQEIQDPRIRDPVRLVLLSDLHGQSFGWNNEWLLRMVRREKPDLVLAAGDMYSAGDSRGRERALDLMGRLAKEFPVYYVNGEHDRSESFFEELENRGVFFLDYESPLVTVGKTTLRLYGITNVYYTPTFDLNNAFFPDPDHFSILLAHSENQRAFAAFGVDLALCGDTHGGQVRLPFFGALYNGGYWLPELKTGSGCEFTKGLYRQGETSLFITGGLGNYPVPVRLFNRPEIVSITLLPERG